MRTRHSGFTLTELLVGIVIALLGSLAIMQAYTGREGDRRAIGSLSDTQANAMIGLFMIERDLQQAGMGLADLRALGCTVSSASNAISGLPLFSVGIVPADGSYNPWNLPLGDANSDILMLAYGTSENTAEGQSLTQATGTSVTLAGNQGINLNNYLLVAESGLVCTLGRMAAAPSSTVVTLDTPAAAAYSSSARVFNLGLQPRLLAYAVRNGYLTMCNFSLTDCRTNADDPTVWVPVVNDIVSLQAQYGVDTSVPPDDIVDAYCQAAGNGACAPGTAPAPSTACDFARIGAIHLALISRSPQADKIEVSPATLKVWEDAAQAPTTTGPEWNVPDRHYRYRAVSSSIALRNLQMMGVPTGC